MKCCRSSSQPVYRDPGFIAAAPKDGGPGVHHGPLKLLCALLLITLSCNTSAQIHEQVQAALDWQLPLNDCKKPKLIDDQQILAHGGSISHSPTNTTEDSHGTPTVFDVDHYKIDRYERRKKRWETCVSSYKSELLKTFEVLKSSVQYGLTKQQAETILGKLAQIQAAIVSPEGVAKGRDKTQ